MMYVAEVGLCSVVLDKSWDCLVTGIAVIVVYRKKTG